MPPITAIVHIRNDATRLGRTLESLRPCDEILVVDHDSTDDSLRIAREYGAKIQSAHPRESADSYLAKASCDWILCILPSETLTEGLEASLYEWKLASPAEVANIPAAAVVVREERAGGWSDGAPCTRLVPRRWSLWDGELPRHPLDSMLLQGDLLRFRWA